MNTRNSRLFLIIRNLEKRAGNERDRNWSGGKRFLLHPWDFRDFLLEESLWNGKIPIRINTRNSFQAFPALSSSGIWENSGKLGWVVSGGAIWFPFLFQLFSRIFGIGPTRNGAKGREALLEIRGKTSEMESDGLSRDLIHSLCFPGHVHGWNFGNFGIIAPAGGNLLLLPGPDRRPHPQTSAPGR